MNDMNALPQPSEAPQGVDPYAHLLDPNTDLTNLSVEAAARQVEAPAPASVDVERADVAAIEPAAVRPEAGTTPPAQTSHREGYWTPPTQEQIDNAAGHGIDLTKQAKYF